MSAVLAPPEPVVQCSFAAFPRLLHAPFTGVALSPSQIARRLGLEAEHSFDDLDYFEFLGIESGGLRFGFLRHRGAPEGVSLVASDAPDAGIVRPALRALLGVPLDDTLRY